MSNRQNVIITDPDRQYKPYTAANPMPVSAAFDTSGLATLVEQQSQTAKLTTIATNTTKEAGAYSFSKALPVLLTTYEGGSSLNVVGSQSGNVKVYIDDANPDFVVNSGMATLVEQQSQTTHLSTIAGDTTSLDSKVVSCDTTGKSTLLEQQSQTTQLTTIAGPVIQLEKQLL
jgi:hypothetical protein